MKHIQQIYWSVALHRPFEGSFYTAPIRSHKQRWFLFLSSVKCIRLTFGTCSAIYSWGRPTTCNSNCQQRSFRCLRFSVNTHQSKNYAVMFWSKISAKTMKTFFCEKFLIVPSFSFQPRLEFWVERLEKQISKEEKEGFGFLNGFNVCGELHCIRNI